MESTVNKAHVQVYVQKFKIGGKTTNYLLTINYSSFNTMIQAYTLTVLLRGGVGGGQLI